MKIKHIFALAFLFAMFATTYSGYAQKPGTPFKGVINYSVSYPDTKLEASQLAALPQKIKVSLHGNKSRIDVNMQSMNQVFLMNSDLMTSTVLIDMMGNKIAIKPNKKADNAKTMQPVVAITSETKEIAGFVCKKAEINFGDEKSQGSPIIVYFTEAIGNNKIFYDNEYRTLPGIPMEFHYKLQGMNMLLTATSVEKGKVSNRDFEVPSGYKEMTPQELRQMFGGGL